MAQPVLLTATEYFALDRASDRKFELIDGRLFMMAGGTPDHAQLSFMVGAILRGQFKDRPCRGFSSDLRVALSPVTYAYPDHTVICGEVETLPGESDTVTNPTAVFEVISESTESYDVGLKRERYARVPSVRAIVLIWPDRALVETHERQGDDSFVWRRYEGLTARVPLSSLDVEIPLSELYEGVSWHPRSD